MWRREGVYFVSSCGGWVLVMGGAKGVDTALAGVPS